MDSTRRTEHLQQHICSCVGEGNGARRALKGSDALQPNHIRAEQLCRNVAVTGSPDTRELMHLVLDLDSETATVFPWSYEAAAWWGRGGGAA